MKGARSFRFSTRTKLWIAFTVVVVMIAMLIRTAVSDASTYYLTVSELMSKGMSAVGQTFTVSGNIVGSSVHWTPESETLKFEIVDKPGESPLQVVFHGPKPDDFGNNWPVIVTGNLQSGSFLNASKLLIKCPSKYQTQTTQKTYTSSFTS